MSQTLKAKYEQKTISILDIERPKEIAYGWNSENKIILQNDHDTYSYCINCIHPTCMEFYPSSTDLVKFRDFSNDTNLRVCPIDAIHRGSENIVIDENACIGCGLCAGMCPIGAIHIDEKCVAKVSTTRRFKKKYPINDFNVQLQRNFIEKMMNIPKTGYIIEESDIMMTILYRKIKRLSQEEQDILARNLLICLGNQTALSRKGNVYLRMDGIYDNECQYGVLEIETGSDMLDVSRALLDDVAVLQARYGIDKKTNHPLAIVLSLPNKRTDYWQVVKDIRDITGLKINTITFGALLVLFWNFKKLTNFDEYYIDIDNPSIRPTVERMIDYEVELSNGHLGILEAEK